MGTLWTDIFNTNSGWGGILQARCLAHHYRTEIFLANYDKYHQTVTAMRIPTDINNAEPSNCPIKDIPRDAQRILLFNGINHYWKVMPIEPFEVDDNDTVNDHNDATKNVTNTANKFFSKRQADIKQYEKDFPHLTNIKKLFDIE